MRKAISNEHFASWGHDKLRTEKGYEIPKAELAITTNLHIPKSVVSNFMKCGKSRSTKKQFLFLKLTQIAEDAALFGMLLAFTADL